MEIMKEAILVTRTVKCSELTKEQFVEMMMEDLRNAVIKSEEVFKPFEEALHNTHMADIRKYVENRARNFASNKWKTEKRREKYVADELAKVDSHPFIFRPVSFFDFNVEPGSNGISDDCVLSVNAIAEDLGRCFEEIRSNKYFLAATGWNLVESRSFRSKLMLILPENMEEMYRNEIEDLNKAMDEFYKCTPFYRD